ncbi:MAG: ABC transporter ATP-binding protein [Patescibacteria group bacterium]
MNTAAVHEPLVAMRGITKRFPGVLANDRVDLEIRPGEIHALLGENGAGKSTLMKVLYGYFRADAGEIRLDGRPARILSPNDARRLGIGMVFQSFTLIPALTVAENIALYLPKLPAVLNRRHINERIRETAERYGLAVDPQVAVKHLSVGEQQRVEIVKLLLAEARILIFDEPTKVLAPHEVEGLLRVFDNLKRDGYAVVFITHKLQEALHCADRITVMRGGRVAGTLPGAGATESGLVSLMFEAAVPEPAYHRAAAGSGTPLLELRRIGTRGAGGTVALEEIDLAVQPGEIVGVAGVAGNGQRELGDVVLGVLPCTRGAKLIAGRDATRWPVAQVRAAGVAFVPEDPFMAAVPGMSVLENMALGATRAYARRGGFAMDWRAVRVDTTSFLQRLGMRIPPLESRAAALSGGNLQRIVLARELSRGPKLIVAFYPTRGLDVPSAARARELLMAARDGGAGVLLISEDLGELFSLGDRLVVLHRGRIAGVFRPEETTVNAVGHLMTGSRSRDGNSA